HLVGDRNRTGAMTEDENGVRQHLIQWVGRGKKEIHAKLSRVFRLFYWRLLHRVKSVALRSGRKTRTTSQASTNTSPATSTKKLRAVGATGKRLPTSSLPATNVQPFRATLPGIDAFATVF